MSYNHATGDDSQFSELSFDHLLGEKVKLQQTGIHLTVTVDEMDRGGVSLTPGLSLSFSVYLSSVKSLQRTLTKCYSYIPKY